MIGPLSGGCHDFKPARSRSPADADLEPASTQMTLGMNEVHVKRVAKGKTAGAAPSSQATG
jgi:hypothetical protein